MHASPTAHRAAAAAASSWYEQAETLGHGTYGTVRRAIDHRTNTVVALKRMHVLDGHSNKSEGIPRTAIRELKILQTLQHENIVSLKEVTTLVDAGGDAPTYVFVFEYMDMDLRTFLRQRHANDTEERIAACLFGQLIAGLAYLHANRIMHRDLTTTNLLVNKHGVLKICDFGLASPVYEDAMRRYTPTVVTLWYRAPELLLFTAGNYTAAIDMWAAGCVLAEMFTRRVLFRAESELRMIEVIFAALGTPTAVEWPALYAANMNFAWNPKSGWNLMAQLPRVSDEALRCVRSLLVCNPRHRATAETLLTDPWLRRGDTQHAVIGALVAAARAERDGNDVDAERPKRARLD